MQYITFTDSLILKGERRRIAIGEKRGITIGEKRGEKRGITIGEKRGRVETLRESILAFIEENNITLVPGCVDRLQVETDEKRLRSWLFYVSKLHDQSVTLP